MNDHLYVGGNGSVYALDVRTCQVVWSLDLKPGWFVAGNPFVSLRETEHALYAFAYGTLYQIDKHRGTLVRTGPPIKNLKYKAGVFATQADAAAASDAETAILGDGDGDGNGNGNGDGGD
jgi:outer membrane protein assembly factor BamB